MKRLALALCLALAACRDPQVPQAERELLSHAAACTAIGEVVISFSQSQGEPCWMTQLRLSSLVVTNSDCKAYWGDGGVEVDLDCAPVKDGGTDVGDR